MCIIRSISIGVVNSAVLADLQVMGSSVRFVASSDSGPSRCILEQSGNAGDVF